MTDLHAHLQKTLTTYAALFGETDSVKAFRVFIAAHSELASRKNLAGHVTGSALVWHKATHAVLRVYHAKLNRWVFSAGGHIDEGEMPWQTATRELREETGITAHPVFDPHNPAPLIIAAHPIPASPPKAEPAHWHYDLVYLFAVDEKPDIKPDPREITRFQWVDIDDVTNENSPVDLRGQMDGYKVG